MRVFCEVSSMLETSYISTDDRFAAVFLSAWGWKKPLARKLQFPNYACLSRYNRIPKDSVIIGHTTWLCQTHSAGVRRQSRFGELAK